MTASIFTRNTLARGSAMSIAVLLAIGTAMPHTLGAQDPSGKPFDIDRAYIQDHTIFVPLEVKETIPLRQALKDGRIDEATQLLILNRREGQLALVTGQMAYHHVAQGEMNGEPWMVSF